MINNPRLILQEPLWIVADDTLGELEWQVRSAPMQHLALGMGLVEELRAVKHLVTNHELGKILGIELESFNLPPLAREGYYYTYSDLVRCDTWPVSGAKK